MIYTFLAGSNESIVWGLKEINSLTMSGFKDGIQRFSLVDDKFTACLR